MNMKTMKAALAALALMTMTAVGAWAADSNPANDKDSLTIRITPSVDLGVDVDTATTRFNYADAPGVMDVSLALGATAYLISPASVTIQGNFGSQELEVVGQSLDTWSLDADETAGGDSLQLYALFANNKTSAPVEGEFAANGVRNLVTTVASMAGQAVADEATPGLNNRYELDSGMDGFTNVDGMTPGTLKQLWLRADVPPTSTSEEQQRFVVTLTAKNGVLN